MRGAPYCDTYFFLLPFDFYLAMFILLSRFFTILFVLYFYGASAGPVVLCNSCNKFSLSFAAKVNYTGYRNLLEADRARAARLRRGSILHPRDNILAATNGVVSYTAMVGVGDPPTSCELCVPLLAKTSTMHVLL
jgi:hypothetical protein